MREIAVAAKIRDAWGIKHDTLAKKINPANPRTLGIRTCFAAYLQPVARSDW